MTYATNATSNAPSNLTTAQLNAIYTCTDTNWSQVGGKSAPIDAQLPQTSSGTRAFFLSRDRRLHARFVREQHGRGERGRRPVLKGPNVIFAYSIGKYIAEKFHSAKCLKSELHRQPGLPPEQDPEQVRL